MTKKNFFLRNVVAIAICLAGFNANNVLAQTVSYTDASGVTCTYEYAYGNYAYARLTEITAFPSSVTKWVIPEYITFSNGTFPLKDFTADNYADGTGYQLPENNTLREVVFPNQMEHTATAIFSARIDIDGGRFTNIHKVTFGTMINSVPAFNANPLDTVIFLGSDCFFEGTFGGNWVFVNCPATTKVFVPCGKLSLFVNSFNADPSWWQHPNGITWTSANFIEAECLNTLTVLSSDNALGNAYSFAGCGFVTQTPDNTSANHSGAITLLALPGVGVVFTGWNDGNSENPRVVNVTEDATYTAQFAACTNTAIETLPAQSGGISVYPNPVENVLNVETDREVRNATLSLFDMNGKALVSQAISGNRAVINTASLSGGVYMLQVVEDGKIVGNTKVVK
jgi:hypothetical protein